MSYYYFDLSSDFLSLLPLSTVLETGKIQYILVSYAHLYFIIIESKTDFLTFKGYAPAQ